MARFLIAALVAIGCGACVATSMRIEQSLEPTFADLTTLKTVEVVTHTGDVLLRGQFSEAAGEGARIERTAALTSPTNAATRGTAAIEIDRVNGLSDEELRIELTDLPYPQSCRLVADGREVTLFSTTENGRLSLRLTRRVTLSNGR